MSSEFDQYVSSYREIINRGTKLTGEKFEYFIGVRLDLVLERLGARGADQRALDILDFGCGIGATEEIMRAKFPAATIVGVDPSAESIEHAQKMNLPSVRFEALDGETLPLPDASVDLVYSNGTFHHIDHAKHPRVFDELIRVLRPGGLAVIFENNPLNPLMVHGMRNNPFDADAHTLIPWSLQAKMKRAGFRTEVPQFYCFYPGFLKGLRWSERYLRNLPLGAQYYVAGVKPKSS